MIGINSQNIVEDVFVIHDNECLDDDGNESEIVGARFCIRHFGSGTYLQTSYNTFAGGYNGEGTPLRKNYAGIGFVYDLTKDAFYESQPFASWKLNDSTCLWEAPLAYPDDGEQYRWDENDYQADNSEGWVLLTK